MDRKTDGFYIYMDSLTCSDLYPENSASKFRFKIPMPVKLDENQKWSVALLDIDFPKASEEYNPNWLTVSSSLCSQSVLGSGLQPVLYRFYYSEIKRGKPFRVEHPRYIRVNVTHLDIIEMVIRDDRGVHLPFNNKRLTCTLHVTRDI